MFCSLQRLTKKACLVSPHQVQKSSVSLKVTIWTGTCSKSKNLQEELEFMNMYASLVYGSSVRHMNAIVDDMQRM